MGAVSGDINSLSMECVDASDLASRPIASMKSGDRAYVRSKVGTAESPRFFLDKTSVLPVDGVGVLATLGGVGRWLSETLYPGPVGPVGGDLSGTLPDPRVVGFNNVPIDLTPPTNGDALLYNGMIGEWQHAPITFAGGPPTGPAGGDLGGLYPNPGVVGLQLRPVSAAAPTTLDLLGWDGAQWTPTSPSVVVGAAAPIYGSFSDSTDQLFVAGGAYVVKYDTVEGSNGVTVANNTDPVPRPTRLTVAQAGIYSFAISPQLLHTGGGQEIVTFWARVDGLNVPRSASSLEMGNNNNRTLPFIEIVLPMNAGQYLEWVFTSTTGTNLTLEAYAATVTVPAIPSVIATVKRLGKIPP